MGCWVILWKIVVVVICVCWCLFVCFLERLIVCVDFDVYLCVLFMIMNVLIFCIYNFVCSVLLEGMFNYWVVKFGKEVCVYSVGSVLSGCLNLFVLEVLMNVGVDVSGCCSKSWDEFVGDGVLEMCVVIMVCDSVVFEVCLYWFGSFVKVYWGYVDLLNVIGGDDGKCFVFELIC